MGFYPRMVNPACSKLVLINEDSGLPLSEGVCKIQPQTLINFFNMDTTLEDRRINWFLIALYGIIAALPGIIANLIYVYLIGEPMSDTYELGFNQEYMTRIGVFIFMVMGFLSYAGISFWISKRNRTRTLYNSVRLVFVGFLVELLFYWIIGVEYRIGYAFTLAVYLVAVLLAAFTPLMLKGKRKHLKDWDARKDEQYEKQTRK